ncbi:MAG: cytochrome c [Neisseria sp.]|nr:cytochrome c [Neisseria sp.]
MKKLMLAALLSALTLSACGGAATSGGTEPQRGPNSEKRATAFKVLGGDMKEMGDVVKGASAYDVEKFKAKVTEFVAHSQEPFKHFAQDGNGMDGNAKPEIWSAPEQYKAEEAKFVEAVTQFNAAAQAGNLEQIKATFGAVGGSCKSCHDAYKISR